MKCYGIVGTIEVPNDADVYEIVSKMAKTAKGCSVKLDQVDLLDEDED